MGTQHYHTARQNHIKYNTNKHASLTIFKMHKNRHKRKTKATFSRLLRYPEWKRSGIILVEWEAMEKHEKNFIN